MHDRKAGHTEGRAADAALPSANLLFLVIMVLRAFVTGRALGAAALGRILGAAALCIVCIARVVCIVCVGRIIHVVRTHSRMTSCNKYLQE